MDWSTRSSSTNFQTNNTQIQEQHQSQQFPATSSQANASVQNSFTYSGNAQTIKVLSNRMNTLANNLPFQNPFQNTLQPTLPKAPVHKNFQPPHHVLFLRPNSLERVSSEIVQVAADMTQNSSLTKNVHISSPVIVQGSTQNPMQNIPQKTVNPPVALDSYNNRPLQTCSNSVTTSVYWQKSKRKLCPKGLTPVHYYHVNGPATSQIDATVPFYQASSQQNPPCLVFPLQQNTQNQTNEPSSSLTMALHPKYYAPNTASPIQYGMPAQHNFKNAAETFPQDRNPPPYPGPPAQRNHGQFVLPQAVSNISRENVQNYHSPVLDQSSNLYSAQLSEKQQSVPFTRESNEVGNIPCSASGYRTENQLPNELAKSSVEVGASLCNSVQAIGTVPSDAALTRQTGGTLEQEKDLTNGSRYFPHKLKDKITRERLVLDGKKLHVLKKALSKLDQDYKMRCKLYQSSVQNGQAADSAVHNQNAAHSQNPDISLPAYNANLSLSLPLPKDTNQAVQPLPRDTSQTFPPTSYSSGEAKDVPLSLKTNNHLMPILRHMLKGTTDENMLFNNYAEKEGSCHLAIKDNSSSAPMLSSSDVSGTHVNNIDVASRLRSDVTMDSTQVPLTCTNNGPGYELPTRAANSHLVSWSKSTMEITDNVQSSNQNPSASNGSSLLKEERECIEQSDTCLQKNERKNTAGSSENIYDSLNSASLPKTTVQEAGITQKSSFSGSSSVSWEVVKKSLALWTKRFPASLKQLCKNKDSTVSLSLSEVGLDGGKSQQTLENLPSALTQKDQTKVTVGSNETTTPSAPSSLGKKLDVVNSNLLKGSELQVAIVTPLILSKESIQYQVQKNPPSLLEVTYPIIEENSVHSLQELSSLGPADDEGAGETLCSSSNTGISVTKEDTDMHERNTKSNEENLIVKAEMNKDCLIHQVPQKDVKSYKSSSDLPEPGDTAEAVLNDTMLEIAGVCTLVQGDEFYNSNIACIFNSSPLKASKKNDTSEEYTPYLHPSEQHSGLLKSESEIISASEGDTFLPSQERLSDAATEKSLEELSSFEIPQSEKAINEGNAIDSEEGKRSSMPQDTPLSGVKPEQDTLCDRIHSADFCSDNEILPVNKGNLPSSSIVDGTNTTAEENATKNAQYEGNQADSGTDIEAPKVVINDQLTELLKEFPYGICFPEALKTPENNNFVTKRSENEEETLSSIQITILTSEQMKEMFPEQSQSSSDIQKNSEDDQFSTAFKDNLMDENKSHSQTDQAVPYDSRNTSEETPAAKPTQHKYCCLRGWLASRMEMDPCKCKWPEKVASEQKVDICPQPKTISKPEADAKTSVQENGSKIDPEIVSLSSPKNLGYQELNIPVKQEMEELQLHTSPTVKNETIEIKIQNHTHEIDNASPDKTQCHSSTKDLKVVAARSLSKIETSVKQRPSKGKLVRSKTEHRKRRTEIRHNTYHERYKIKRDSSETHIIKGPTLSKGLKRKITLEKKHHALLNQHNDSTRSPNISSIKIKSPQHKSTMLSPEHSNVRKKFDFEKKYGFKKFWGHMRINNEPSRTEHVEHNEEPSRTEHVEHNEESIQLKSQKLNLEKFAYSKEKKNAGNYRNHLDASPKLMSHASNTLKIPFSVKETVLDTRNRDKRLERSLSDKKTCFNRRTGRLSISLQREQKKKYLNQVAFKRIAQKTICLTNLDSHSKPVWHVKSSSVSALCDDQKTRSASCQQPEVEKQQMLEFKMCPEILFRKSVSEEQLLDGNNLPEKGKSPITAVKSKREDWLNYNPVKRRKTEECEAQVNDDIPLGTAIKLLEGMPVKDSRTTFQTYKKMHLEKRSQSLDSTPLNKIS